MPNGNQNGILAGTISVVSGKLNSGALSGTLNNGGLSGNVSIPKSSTIGNYEALLNKPQINGVELSGNKTVQDLYIVSENTIEGWDSNPQYLPKAGEICIYTDYMEIQDDLGNIIICPGIKVGDGNSYLIDMPFVGAEIRYEVLNALRQHEQNTLIHVSQADRDFWNNKLNYDAVDEELILTRN